MAIVDLTVTDQKLQMELDHDFVAVMLNNGEPWEDTVRRLWVKECQRLPQESHVLDIGAYTGIYSLLAASLGMKVTAFEPLPRIFERLESNVRLNQFDARINCVNVALSNAEGTTSINLTGSSKLPSGSSVDPHPTKKTLKSVPITRLVGDSLAMPRVSLIKMDVERHEFAALQGLEQHLRQQRPVVFVEILDAPEVARITTLMFSYGYDTVELVCEDLHTTVSDERVWTPTPSRTMYIFR